MKFSREEELWTAVVCLGEGRWLGAARALPVGQSQQDEPVQNHGCVLCPHWPLIQF